MRLIVFLCGLQMAWSCLVPRPPPAPATTQAPTAGPPVPGACRCGTSKTRSTRIVGGVTTAKNEFPWQVLLTNSDGSLRCGGSLLSSTTVLTAAHCASSRSTVAVLGEHDRYSSDGEVKISVSRWENAPGYNSNSLDNDFAIATLERPVVFSDTIYPVCLPTDSSTSYENRDAIVSGWGTLYSGGPSSRILMKAGVRTMRNAVCTSNTAYSSSEITNRMICANEAGKDSCQGDSGGPLVVKKSGANYFEQVGVVSWGYGCARADAPGVYARVTSNLGWIRSKITGTTCASP